jgi:hypothetical protein
MESTTIAPADEFAEEAARAIASRRAGYIAGLRLLADALEQHPDADLPADGTSLPLSITFWGEDARERMAAAARAIPCTWTKQVRDSEYRSYFDLSGNLAGLKISLTAYRDAVCERVVTGTHEETKTVPDPEALAAVPQVTVTNVVEHVTWECHSILKPDADESAPVQDTEAA